MRMVGFNSAEDSGEVVYVNADQVMFVEAHPDRLGVVNINLVSGMVLVIGTPEDVAVKLARGKSV